MFTIGVTDSTWEPGILLSLLFIDVRRNHFTSAMALIGRPVVFDLFVACTGRNMASFPDFRQSWKYFTWAPAATGFAVSLAIGIAMAWIVEIPVLRFRDRLFPSLDTRSPAIPLELPIPSVEVAGTAR